VIQKVPLSLSLALSLSLVIYLLLAEGGGIVKIHNAVRDLFTAALHQAHISFAKESTVPVH